MLVAVFSKSKRVGRRTMAYPCMRCTVHEDKPDTTHNQDRSYKHKIQIPKKSLVKDQPILPLRFEE